MREKTKERKAKLAKNKEKVDEVMKDAGISRKLSKVDQNKLILKAMTADVDDSSKEKIITNKMSTRHFKCKCGCDVTLEGDVAKNMSITTCTSCNK